MNKKVNQNFSADFCGHILEHLADLFALLLYSALVGFCYCYLCDSLPREKLSRGQIYQSYVTLVT